LVFGYGFRVQSGTMSSPSTQSEMEKCVEEVLQLLSDMGADESDASMQKLALKASRVVGEMRASMQISPSAQLAALVEDEDWEGASEMLKSAADSEELVKQVVGVVYKDDEDMLGSIKWVKHLEARLQPVACEALYELIKAKKHTSHMQLLLLLKYVRKLNIGVRDIVRTSLECHGRGIIDQLVEEIKRREYEHLSQLPYVQSAVKFFIPTLVRHFDIGSVQSVLLLVSYSQKLKGTYDKLCLGIVQCLLQSFEDHLLLHSMQAMHVWVHVASLLHEVKGRGLSFRWVQTVRLLQQPLDKLDKLKTWFFLHYRTHLEHPDKQRVRDLHKMNPDMKLMLDAFTEWYYNGDSCRTDHLLEAATQVGCILEQLHVQLSRWQHLNTFHAFRLFSQIKKSHSNFRAETPECVDLLLSDSKKLRLINKLCKLPLCVRQGNVLCCDSQDDGQQLFNANVDPDTALTTLSFKAGHLAEQGGVAVVADAGTRWMLKPLDENHVKIFTTDGNLHFDIFFPFLKILIFAKKNNPFKIWVEFFFYFSCRQIFDCQQNIESKHHRGESCLPDAGKWL
jgi:hypothetical protein